MNYTKQVNRDRDSQRHRAGPWFNDDLGSGHHRSREQVFQRRGDHGLARRRCREARRAARVRQRHTDSGSGDGDGRSLHRSGEGTRLTAAVDPNLCELQSNRRQGSEDLDSRGPASDASIDAALSAAASMRPDRRRSWLPRSSQASPTLGWSSSHTRRPVSSRRASPSPARSTDPKERKRPSWDTARRRHEAGTHPPDTLRCGTENGASGLRYCEESSTRLGGSGPYPATFAPATPVAAFF